MRTLTAVFLTAFAGVAIAGSNTQYSNEAGEQDLATPIAANSQYNNEAGRQDQHQPEIG